MSPDTKRHAGRLIYLRRAHKLLIGHLLVLRSEAAETHLIQKNERGENLWKHISWGAESRGTAQIWDQPTPQSEVKSILEYISETLSQKWSKPKQNNQYIKK